MVSAYVMRLFDFANGLKWHMKNQEFI